MRKQLVFEDDARSSLNNGVGAIAEGGKSKFGPTRRSVVRDKK